MKEKKLTTKQQRFVDYYDGNATEAARKAGYKGNDNTLASVGDQNLRKPAIKGAIEKRQKADQTERNISRQEKQEILADLIRNDATYIVTNKDGREEIKPDVPIKERIKAIDTHNKMDGEYVTKVEHSGDVDKPIKHDITVRIVKGKK